MQVNSVSQETAASAALNVGVADPILKVRASITSLQDVCMTFDQRLNERSMDQDIIYKLCRLGEWALLKSHVNQYDKDVFEYQKTLEDLRRQEIRGQLPRMILSGDPLNSEIQAVEKVIDQLLYKCISRRMDYLNILSRIEIFESLPDLVEGFRDSPPLSNNTLVSEIAAIVNVIGANSIVEAKTAVKSLKDMCVRISQELEECFGKLEKPLREYTPDQRNCLGILKLKQDEKVLNCLSALRKLSQIGVENLKKIISPEYQLNSEIHIVEGAIDCLVVDCHDKCGGYLGVLSEIRRLRQLPTLSGREVTLSPAVPTATPAVSQTDDDDIYDW